MSTYEVRDPDSIPLSRYADLQSLPLSTLLVGQDGRIRKARSFPLAHIEPGMPLEKVLSVSYPTLAAAAQSDIPPSLPAILSTTAGPVHVLAQSLPLADGILVIITNLSAVQEAEEWRFQNTPYGVVRLGIDGVVVFANDAARRLWNDAGLVGESFADLLPKAFRPEFVSKFKEVLASRTARAIRLTSGAEVMVGDHTVHSEPRLTLLPEFLTKDALRGVQVVIREGILNALRVALREAAIGTTRTGSASEPINKPSANWRDRTRRMLDLLRDVLPHNLAIISEVSESGEWIRPILMHPEPEDSWPRMWWRTSKKEQDQLSAEPFREELSEWIRRNPDRKDEPLLKLLQAVKPDGNALESFAVVPIRPQGRAEAVLTLASTQPKRFLPPPGIDPAELAAAQDDEELPRDPLAVLSRLGLDALIVAMLQRAKVEERIEEKSLVESIAKAETVPRAASILLRELVSRFGWDHAAVFIAHRPDALEADGSKGHDHKADPGEVLRPFVQYPELENGIPHPLAIRPDYVQPLYDPELGEDFDEKRALASGMLGAAIRSARHGGTGILVASDVTERDDKGRPPHWFRSISDKQHSALTIALTINGRTRWVLDTVSRQPNAFIEEDGARVAPLVKSLAQRISELRQNKLNERLVDLMDKAVVITDETGLILQTNSRARELLGLPHMSESEGLQACKTDDCNLSTFVHGCGLPGMHESEKTLCMGPRQGTGVETHVHRYEDVTRTSDIIWVLSGADRETYNVDTKYIADTVQEVARQARAPLLLAATLAKQLGRGQLQDLIAPMAQRVSEGIAKADITFERLAEARGALRAPKREDRIVRLDALLNDIFAKLSDGDRARMRLNAAGDIVVSGDRGRLTYALRTLLNLMLSRDNDPVSITLRDLDAQAQIELSGADLTQLSTSDDLVRAQALEAAANGQKSVQAILSAHGGRLERTPTGFLLHVPVAQAREAQP
jgi:PAS domain-containing protein